MTPSQGGGPGGSGQPDNLKNIKATGAFPSLPPRPTQNLYLTFQGIGAGTGHHQAFDVMAGTNPPTITGGYAQWTEIPRPLQRALTVFTGYGALTMTVEVRFGVWAGSKWQNDNATGQQVEGDINSLEWMAGSSFQTGPSPYVYVWSYSNQGGVTNLIPKPGQGFGKAKSLPWIITDLQWGKAYRNRNGYRTWQEATIVLKNYMNVNKAPPPDRNTRGGYFQSRAGRDTALLIAGSPAEMSPKVDHQILARKILAASQNNPIKDTSIRLQRKHISWQIRHGLKVWVPGHVIQ